MWSGNNPLRRYRLYVANLSSQRVSRLCLSSAIPYTTPEVNSKNIRSLDKGQRLGKRGLYLYFNSGGPSVSQVD